jgi:hypothetical protein
MPWNHFLAAYIPYRESEQHAHDVMSHQSHPEALAILFIIALGLFWFFKRR